MECGGQRIKIARSILRTVAVKLVRRVSVFDEQEFSILLVTGSTEFRGGAKIDQRHVAVRAQKNVIGRQITVQQTLLMNILNRVKRLDQQAFDHCGIQSIRLIFDNREEVIALDVFHRQKGCAVLLEHLMHADNARVRQSGQTQRLRFELSYNPIKFRCQMRLGRRNVRSYPYAEGMGEAFLDHHLAIKTVPRQIGDAKTAFGQRTVDVILTAQKLSACPKVFICICGLRQHWLSHVRLVTGSERSLFAFKTDFGRNCVPFVATTRSQGGA